MKKLIYILLVGVLIFTFSFSWNIYNKNKEKLLCDKNGDFTILVVSDPQCDNPKQWLEAKTELEILVKRSKPNLVMICGDMNTKNEIPEEQWAEFVSPLTERNIYWATVNGNHDSFKEKHFQMYKSYDKCLNSKLGTDDINYEEDRPVNYVLPIYSNDSKTPVFAVYGMDTGDSNQNGYEGLTEKQIRWYEEQSENLKRINGSNPVTSLLCVHIPLTQTVDMYYSNEGANPAKEKVPGGLYKVYGINNEEDKGMKNYICENGTVVPEVWFSATARANDRGIFDKILKQGDIKAVLFGHVHRTNIIGSYKGVLLGFTGKLSTGCYSDELCRGGRVVRFNQSNPDEFTVSWLGALRTSADQPAIYSDGSIAE